MSSPGSRPCRVSAVVVTFWFLIGLTTAEASTFDNKPKILMHAQGVTAKVPCSVVNISDCQDAVTEGKLVSGSSNFYFAYLLVAKGSLPDLDGLQLGVSYQDNLPGDLMDGVGIDIFGWTLCGYFEGPQPTPAWPSPLSGNLITWGYDDYPCPNGDFAVAGYFYLGAYSDDVLEVIPRPVDGVAKVATCAFVEHILDPADLGSVAFSSGAESPGCNPCDGPCPLGVPVQPATWSGVKLSVR